MAKTYEALLKSGQSSHEEFRSKHSVSTWKCPDLTGTKEIGTLWNHIDMAAKTKDFNKINFVSSRSGEGTSTIIFNLAKLVVENKLVKDVLIIDASLRRPVINQAFGLPLSPGLSDVLMKKVEYQEAIHRVSSSNLSIIPAGSIPSDSPFQIQQENFSDLISAVKDNYQHILIDSAPLLISSDSFQSAISTDMTFLIVRANNTQWEVVEKAKNHLLDANCNIAGVILNRVMQPIPQWLYDRL